MAETPRLEELQAPGPAGPGVHLLRGARRGVPPPRHASTKRSRPAARDCCAIPRTSARVTLGRALVEIGEFDEARAELEQVLQSAPENLAAIRALADIHRRRGEMPDADHYARRFAAMTTATSPAAFRAGPPLRYSLFAVATPTSDPVRRSLELEAFLAAHRARPTRRDASRPSARYRARRPRRSAMSRSPIASASRRLP